MPEINSTIPTSQISPHIHWGHFSVVIGTMVLLGGLTFLSKPELFSFKNNSNSIADVNVPHYYAYVPPTEDKPLPAVLGASTNDGPSIINEDGSVSSVDMGKVLGASTEDSKLSLDGVTISTVADSEAAITKYLSDEKAVEISPIEDGNFETALSTNDQKLIGQELQRLVPIRNSLQKIIVPVGFSKLHKLKIVEYNSAIALLQNFSQMNINPQLVGEDLQSYLNSQQSLIVEINLVAQKYNLDPNSIGPAGETAVLAGTVQGASQGAAQAAAILAQGATSTPASFLAPQ